MAFRTLACVQRECPVTITTIIPATTPPIEAVPVPAFVPTTAVPTTGIPPLRSSPPLPPRARARPRRRTIGHLAPYDSEQQGRRRTYPRPLQSPAPDASGPAAPPSPVPRISPPAPARAVPCSPSPPPGVDAPAATSSSNTRTRQRRNERPPLSMTLMDRMRAVQTIMLAIHQLEGQEGEGHDPGGGGDVQSRRRIEELRRRVGALSDVDVDVDVDRGDGGRVFLVSVFGAEGGSTTGAGAGVEVQAPNEGREGREGRERSATPLGPPPAYAASPP